MEPSTISAVKPKAIVLYDGDCGFCKKGVANLKLLDWFGALSYHNARDWDGIPPNSANLDRDHLLVEMHVLTPDRTKAHAGFYAFRWIAGRLPTLWPLWPFLYIPGVPSIGRKFYRWIAKNRFKLVPCGNGECAVPPRPAKKPAHTP